MFIGHKTNKMHEEPNNIECFDNESNALSQYERSSIKSTYKFSSRPHDLTTSILPTTFLKTITIGLKINEQRINSKMRLG